MIVAYTTADGRKYTAADIDESSLIVTVNEPIV